MGIVVSLLVIAVGAIMRFAVTVAGHGFNVHTAGVVLIIVGIIGAMLSIGYWASWGGFGGSGVRRRTTVVGTEAPLVSTEAPLVSTERTVVREREVQ
jgi:hypothetical protein